MLVGLIPARKGSKRVPGKNTRRLAGHPLLAYAIACAQESGVCDRVIVSTDDEGTAELARAYGAEACCHAVGHGDDAPDLAWIQEIGRRGGRDAYAAILRPTSPFRRGVTVAAAFQALRDRPEVDSVRAVRPVREHPGKMWRISPWGGLLYPVLAQPSSGEAWHSRPTQTLMPTYVQSSALEIARWDRTIDAGRLAGAAVMPWFLEWPEDLVIDEEAEWQTAEQWIADPSIVRPTPRLR